MKTRLRWNGCLKVGNSVFSFQSSLYLTIWLPGGWQGDRGSGGKGAGGAGSACLCYQGSLLRFFSLFNIPLQSAIKALSWTLASCSFIFKIPLQSKSSLEILYGLSLELLGDFDLLRPPGLSFDHILSCAQRISDSDERYLWKISWGPQNNPSNAIAYVFTYPVQWCIVFFWHHDIGSQMNKSNLICRLI